MLWGIDIDVWASHYHSVFLLCTLPRVSNFLLARTMDGRIVCCGIISLCQSAATSQKVKCFWSRGWLMQAALYQVPDLYLCLTGHCYAKPTYSKFIVTSGKFRLQKSSHVCGYNIIYWIARRFCSAYAMHLVLFRVSRVVAYIFSHLGYLNV